MDPIMEIANRHGLKVIEDSAQSIGSEYKGRRAGSLGHVGCMSFFPSKNLGAAGDGGMITTNDAEIADRCRLLRTQGYRPKYRNIAVGGNFRLDPIQAAILQVKLRYLDGWSAGRQRNADLYRKYLGEAGLLLSDWKGGSVKGQKGVATLTDMKYGAHVYNQFIIHAGERDALMNFLKERGIGSEIYYPVPVHLQDCFSDKVRYTNLPYKADEFCFYMNLGYKEGDFPHSEVSADESLGLPIYPELTDAMIQEVVQGVADFFKG
jgi:dTDP-4-amino-4,6-dideoxygalactose transaminase